MSAIKYWLWMSTAARLPLRVRSELLTHYGSPENIFNAPEGELRRLVGDCEGVDVLEKRDMSAALRIIDSCREQGIDIITLQDALYPDRLKNVYMPPSVLYVKGKLPSVDDEAAIAVIGTRSASPYGLKMGKKLGFEIAKCGGTVVSLLTKGIDAAAAEGALLAEGKCIGVLGVPHEKAKGLLYDELAVRGALVSELPPGTESGKSFFRTRNRIAAGLAVGVVVVEAPVKSGTALFAAEAAEQGKEIFAVPGNADAVNSVGTNALLKEGAKPVTSGWDVLGEFEKIYPDKLKNEKIKKIPSRSEGAPKSEKIEKKVIDNTKNEVYIDLSKQLKELSETQLKIAEVMEKPSMHIDDIIEQSGLSPARVLAELTLLQLKGYVTQEKGKRFTLNIKTK
ncbi:MAG: DNA-protecting protein DprA [Oscillospiraceae bacterium]|nr:DNA-protecting protein DprA [Oscillospiraceae bacterium]